MTRSCSTVSGLSLLELVIVLSLIAIVMSFGLPVTQYWLQYHYCLLMSQDIKQAIQHAATEALVQGQMMRLMPCLRCKTWSEGVMISQEGDTEHQRMYYEWRWPISDYKVTWHGFLSNHFLRFSPDLGQSALNGYFLIQNDQHQGLKLILNRFGRVRVESLND